MSVNRKTFCLWEILWNLIKYFIKFYSKDQGSAWAVPWYPWIPGSRVVNLRLDKLGRVVPACKFKWTGPGQAGRAKNFCGPGRFLPIYREDFAYISSFFERIMLNLKCVNKKVQILSKIRIEIKFGMNGPARLRISAGPDRAVTSQDFCGPGRAGLSGPKIYNPARELFKFTKILEFGI